MLWWAALWIVGAAAVWAALIAFARKGGADDLGRTESDLQPIFLVEVSRETPRSRRYLPMQNLLKIWSRICSLSILPVRRPRALAACLRSSARSSAFALLPSRNDAIDRRQSSR